MKHNRFNTLLVAGAVSAIALTTAVAQSSSTTTTTTTDKPAAALTSSSSTKVTTTTLDGSGTIMAYKPGADYITFRTETSTAPVMYYYTKNTTIVDPDGKTVEWSVLKPDMPVKYTYVKEADRMVVTKITLTKPVAVYEKTTTTTTTTQP